MDNIDAQNIINVKLQKQSISAGLDDDNSNKVLVINGNAKPLKTDKLVIYNNNKAEKKIWKRSFMIFDEADTEVIKLSTAAKDSYYEIPVVDLLAKLKKYKDYSLYTIAIPTDPKKAATVRVRRILLCKVRVK
jgi:hypothetical protein